MISTVDITQQQPVTTVTPRSQHGNGAPLAVPELWSDVHPSVWMERSRCPPGRK